MELNPTKEERIEMLQRIKANQLREVKKKITRLVGDKIMIERELGALNRQYRELGVDT